MRLTHAHASTHVLPKICFFSPQSSLHRPGTTARHTVPKSLVCFAPTGQSLCLFIPALLGRRRRRRCRQSSDVTSTKLVRFVFFLASSGYGGSSVMRISNDTGMCIVKPIVRDRMADACAGMQWNT